MFVVYPDARYENAEAGSRYEYKGRGTQTTERLNVIPVTPLIVMNYEQGVRVGASYRGGDCGLEGSCENQTVFGVWRGVQ